MRLKKRLVMPLTMTLFVVNTWVSAATPVFDAASVAASAKQWARELQQWQDTATHYTRQVDAYKAQLASATGQRDIGSFVSQARGLTFDLKALQKNGQSLNSLLNSDGAMSPELDTLYSKYSMFDTCNGSQSPATAGTCRQMVVNRALALEESEGVQRKINDTLKDVSQLSSRIENAKDVKETQDLANAMTLKTVQLNALTTQWEMNVKQAEMRDNLLKDKQQKNFRKRQAEAAIPTFH